MGWSRESIRGALMRVIGGVLTPGRASVPTDSLGEDFLVAGNPGVVEIATTPVPVELRDQPISVQMHRRYTTAEVTIEAGEVLSGVIVMWPYVSGVVYIPHEWSAADIGFAVGYDLNAGPWSPAYDDNGNLIQITVNWVDRAFSFPPEIFAHGYIRFWSQRGASNRPQGADRTLHYELKS